MSDAPNLDHLGIAVADATAPMRAFVAELGGAVRFGGVAREFRAVQIDFRRFGGGMNLELLEPWPRNGHGFLARFLRTNGEGPHHITFKVPDLVACLDRLTSAGFRPKGVSLDNPEWKEAFLDPRDGLPALLQLAESPREYDSMEELPEKGIAAAPIVWWPEPPPPAESVAVIRRLVLATGSLERLRYLFADVLEGRIEYRSETRIDLSWPSGARLRLERAADGLEGVRYVECEQGRMSGHTRIGGTTLRFVPGGRPADAALTRLYPRVAN